MAFYNQLRVYEDGGLIVFADASGTVFTSEPKGSVRVKSPSGGMCFENIQTGDEIASVAAPGDVRDATGTAYGATFADVLTALGAFFFIDSGGGGAWQYGKGAYNNFSITNGTFTTGTNPFAANTLLAFAVYVGAEVSVSEMRHVIAVGAVGNSVWGLYTSVDGKPGDLIFQTTPFNNNVTGLKSYSFTPETLKPGIYWVSYNSSSVPSARCMLYTNYPNVYGDDNVFNGHYFLLGRAYAYTGTLPASWGTPTQFFGASSVAIVPYVQFKID